MQTAVTPQLERYEAQAVGPVARRDPGQTLQHPHRAGLSSLNKGGKWV